jgi:hypothetical protein
MGSRTASEAGAAAQKARRRFELLAGELPGVEAGRLPKDELGLMRCGAVNEAGERHPPTDVSLYEYRPPVSRLLGLQGHVKLRSPSTEAQEFAYTPASMPSATESDTEVSLRQEALARKGLRLEHRKLLNGGLLQLLTPQPQRPGGPAPPNLRVALLQLPSKTLYAELSDRGSNLLLANIPNPHYPLNDSLCNNNAHLSI